MTLVSSFIPTIGNTPLIHLQAFAEKNGITARLYAKAEFMNPGSSIKDRIGLAMIETAEKEGKLSKNAVIIEPTSGNTGIALAMVAARKGYKIILTMPESMSIERRKLLQHLGAELVLTPAAGGMQGAIEKAHELAAQTPNSFLPQQFENTANPEIHYKTTGPEIWNDTKGDVDVFVAGIGTGGTISGVGRYFQEKKQNLTIVAVEPSSSPVLSGGSAGPHKIQGIGAGFVPNTLNTAIYREIIQVANEDAIATAKSIAQTEGILVGISAGANVWAAMQLAQRPAFKDKTIVTILPDTAERYLSTDLFA